MEKVLMMCLCASLVGCAGMEVSRENMINANYGARPSVDNAVDMTKSYFQSVLIDPDSLKLHCGQDVRKGWARDNMYDKPIYGYLIRCDVNAKNKFGGYTGNKDYVAVINGQRVVFALEVSRDHNTAVTWNHLIMGYAE